MKRMTNIFNGILALTVILFFARGNNKKGEPETANVPEGKTGTCTLKIAYVEIDTLLTKYNYWNDLNEMMMKKEENIRATLNQKGRELEADAKEFQRKLENNAFANVPNKRMPD